MQEVAALSERSSYNSAQHRRQHLSSFTSLLTFVATMEPEGKRRKGNYGKGGNRKESGVHHSFASAR